MVCDFSQLADGALAAKRALEYWPMVQVSADRYDMDPALVMAVMRTESNFSPGAASNKGAQGLMQLMPGTCEYLAKRLGIKCDPWDPETAIDIGTYYLDKLLKRFLNYDLAVAGYWAGGGGVAKSIEETGHLSKGQQKYADAVLKRYPVAQAACGLPMTPAPRADPPDTAGTHTPHPAMPHGPAYPGDPTPTPPPAKPPAAQSEVPWILIAGLALQFMKYRNQ